MVATVEGLAARLPALPLVLAGPVVRRVEPGAASVWLALRRPAEIELRVHSGGRLRLSGRRRTAALGDNLHIACVTARGERLPWGALCEYEIDIGGRDLFAPGVVAADPERARTLLCYPGGPRRPSFVTPPAEVAELAVFFASCRRFHNEGGDALTAVDRCIAASFLDGSCSRPDALLLVGDQIYADSLSPLSLELAADAGPALLGWSEQLPGCGVGAREVPAGSRRHLAWSFAGHPEPSSSQLFGLGELVAVHLLGLADTLWPAALPAGLDASGAHRRFVAGLGAVRRSLANVATYAVFDDHEVADDWNLTWEWCQRVYSRPLGRRQVQNALLAHALVAAWGNQPDRFEGDAPGARLLELAEGYRDRGGVSGEGDAEIERLLSIPPASALAGDRGELRRPPGALEWSFSLAAPGWDLVCLDTRTCRVYSGPRAAPRLLSPAALEAQLAPIAGGDRDRPLLVVSPPPLHDYALPWIGRAVYFAYYLVRGGGGPGALEVYGPDRGDIWDASAAGLEDLLARLAGRRRVVVLSGDTHCAYAVKTTVEVGDEAATVATLVSSGACRENARTRWQHRVGFSFLPWPRRGRLPDRTRRAAAGWRYRVHHLRATFTGTRRGPQRGGDEIVGRNNVGQVRFAANDGELVARLALWYREAGGGDLAPRSIYYVSLTPEALEDALDDY